MANEKDLRATIGRDPLDASAVRVFADFQMEQGRTEGEALVFLAQAWEELKQVKPTEEMLDVETELEKSLATDAVVK